MAKIFPFRAWRYNPQQAASLADVVTQPYDKISPEMQQRYYTHPFNLVRLILGRSYPNDDEHYNVYTRAADSFRQWIVQGIFVQERQPAFYVYDQRFHLSDGQTKRRKGFIGLGQLEDYAAGVVFPHERTLAGPKADRLKLLRATRTHFEQLFMLCTDPQHQIDALIDEPTSGEPDMKVQDEYGVEHLVWRITDPATIHRLQQLMADKPLIIADGHHRYETALAYRDERRAIDKKHSLERLYERVMMTFFNTESEGLTILPTHRLIKRARSVDLPSFLTFAEQHFQIERYPFSDSARKTAAAHALRQDMENYGTDSPTFGWYPANHDALYRLTFRVTPNSLRLLGELSPRQQKLDVAVLHTIIIEHGLGISPEVIAQEEPIAYVREFDEGIRLIDEGKGVACFFVNPTRIEQVREMALNGEVLPQKSTDFYPKLLSGLTIYRLE